jgi:hypothetical protein
MVRIEVEPRARAAYHERARCFGGFRVPGSAHKMPRNRIAPKDDHGRARCVRDDHDQRPGRGQQQAVEQPKKQHAEQCDQRNAKLATRRKTQLAQVVQSHHVRCRHQHDGRQDRLGQVVKEFRRWWG